MSSFSCATYRKERENESFTRKYFFAGLLGNYYLFANDYPGRGNACPYYGPLGMLLLPDLEILIGALVSSSLMTFLILSRLSRPRQMIPTLMKMN